MKVPESKTTPTWGGDDSAFALPCSAIRFRWHMHRRLQLLIRASCLALASTIWVNPAPGQHPDSGQAPANEPTVLAQVLERLERAESALQVMQAQHLTGEGGATLPASQQVELPDELSISERLQILEKDQQQQAAAAAQKKADDAAKPTFKFNGRLQMDYWAFPYTDAGANAFETGDANDSVDDRFLLRRVRMELSGTIPDLMLYRMQVDFADPNSPAIKDLFLGWEDLPVLQTVLVGNQKRPYALDSINSTRFNIFLERPAVVDAFNTNYRRFGICAYGVTDDLAYNWRYGGFLGQDLQNNGIAQATPIAESYQAEFDARFANTLWYDDASGGRNFAHWALSGVVANTDGNAGAASTARFRTRPEARTAGTWSDTGVILNATSYQIVGMEALINTGPVQFVGEYLHTSVQRSGATDLNFQGEYAYVSYFLTGESMTWERQSGQIGRVIPFENFFLVRTSDGHLGRGWGAWQVAARYDHVDLTDADIQGGIEDSGTLSLVWHWTPFSKLQFNYILGEINQHRPVDGQTSAHYQIVGTRFACDF